MTGPKHEYTTKDGKRYVRVAIADPMCDFCMAPKPPWAYPAKFVPVSAYAILNDVEHWSVCDLCHRLLETEDIDGLVKRIFDSPSHLTRKRIRRIIVRFLDARMGPPTRT